ncbi:hypothetical protein [Streptomyces sp. SID11385]|uniref:hypothetical protein n=1 Tax=Streptomyces sp. SID11385 TaxID=2706031 RepID=UPI0013CAD734|nr:hypothetical protein [Streptomyces sp. SID11385]NEA42726.1 hypothetical protein [Streptomyces sp. SID11385]
MPATTVWLLMSGEDYRGGRVLGAFATYELGMPDFQSEAERLPLATSRTTRGKDGSVHLHSDGDWISLTPHVITTQAEDQADADSDFFQADTTYRRGRWLFQCLSLAPDPFDGDTCAVGFIYRPGEPAAATAFDSGDWARGGWTVEDTVSRTEAAPSPDHP